MFDSILQDTIKIMFCRPSIVVRPGLKKLVLKTKARSCLTLGRGLPNSVLLTFVYLGDVQELL